LLERLVAVVPAMDEHARDLLRRQFFSQGLLHVLDGDASGPEHPQGAVGLQAVDDRALDADRAGPAASGAPESAMSARATGCAGTRTPTDGWPAVTTCGTAPGAAG
jgi:hypothetical protein